MSQRNKIYDRLGNQPAGLSNRIPTVFFRLKQDTRGITLQSIDGGLADIISLDPQEIINNPNNLAQLIPEPDLGTLRLSLQESASQLTACDEEFRVSTLSGLRWFKAVAHPYKTPDGSIVWHGSAMDISLYKQAEHNLSENEQQLRMLFSEAADAISVSNLEGRLLRVNRRACESTGYSREELLKLKVYELDADYASPELFKAFVNDLKPGQPVTLKSRHKRKDGTIFPVEIAVTLFQTSSGGHILCLARDITRRMQAEEALKESEEKYRVLFEGSEALISMVDSDGVFLMINQKLANWFGWQADELIGQKLADMHKNSGEKFQSRVGEVMKDGQARTYQDLVRYPGSHRYLSTSVHPVRNELGEVYAALIISQDITDRKQAEAALRESREIFSLFTHHLPGMVFIKDHKSRYLFVNQKLSEWFGLFESEMLGKTNHEVFEDARADSYYETDKQVLRTGRPLLEIEEFETKDGRNLVMVKHKFRIDREDQPPLIAGFYLDMTARVRAEEELAATKKLLETAIAQTPSGILIADAPDGYIRLANQAALDIRGGGAAELTRADLNAHSISWRTYHPDDKPYPIDEHPLTLALVDGKTTKNQEMIIKDQKGEDRMVIANAAPIMNKQGEVEAGIIIMSDITELQKAEEEKRKTEKRYRGYFNSLNDAIFVYPLKKDGFGDFVEVNRIACERYGYSHEEFYKLSPTDVNMDSEHRDRFPRTGKELLVKQGQLVFEAVHRKKNGDTFPVEVNSNIVMHDGEPYIVAGARDITKRKKAEEALFASHQRFLTVLNSIDAAIYVADLDSYEILFMNKYMVEQYGRDMIGEKCYEAIRHEGRPCADCTNSQLLDEKGDPGEVCVWQFKNPVTRRWSINYDRIIDWTDGKLVKLEIATDITELKIMEKELRQAQKMEALGTLASGIAHDFNNILAIIMGYAERSSLSLPPESDVLESFEEIKHAAERAKSLVRQILTFSRRTDTEAGSLDLNLCVKEAASLIKRTIPKMVEVRLELEEGLKPISGDGQQMEQLLMNLASNAAAAMPHGGVLTISTGRSAFVSKICKTCGENYSGEYNLIRVSDTGVGIEPDQIKRIFDPFFTTKEVGKGTGLGLAMVYGIVTGHHGHVTCDSEVGVGSTFTIYLPMEERPNAPCEPVEPAESAPVVGHETILLVDDEKTLLELAKDMLALEGYQVLPAGSGEKALEIYQKRQSEIDLVVLDLGMPGMGGVKCLEAIKQLNPAAKVLICSGYIQYEETSELTEKGASGFVSKPYGRSDLMSAIRKVLD
jgi:PAS domain S-box-containing protein